MGTFHITLAVGDPQGESYVPVEALVDTGATYTMLPASMLQNLGVVPHDRAEFELADGNVAEMDIGRTWVRIDGRSEIVPIIRYYSFAGRRYSGNIQARSRPCPAGVDSGARASDGVGRTSISLDATEGLNNDHDLICGHSPTGSQESK